MHKLPILCKNKTGSDFLNAILKKCIAVTLVLLLSVIIFWVVTLTLDIKSGKPKESTTVTVRYTLGAYEGKLALFEDGFAMPVEIYDVLLSELPESEQIKISRGIKAYSDEEALKIIEDYTS